MVRQYLHAVPMKGGKLAIEQIHGLMKAGYEQNPEVMGFKIDPEISTKTSKIYVNPNTGEKVVVHRGTQGASDWLNNLVYAYGGTSAYKLTPRYSEAQKVQKKAEQKYGAENISTIGHSQGGLQAELLGGKSKEIITYNKATRPFSNAPKENQYDISTQSDIASKLNPFQQKGHKVILPSKSLNPISEHQLKALEHADKELIVGTGGGQAGQRVSRYPAININDMLLPALSTQLNYYLRERDRLAMELDSLKQEIRQTIPRNNDEYNLLYSRKERAKNIAQEIKHLTGMINAIDARIIVLEAEQANPTIPFSNGTRANTPDISSARGISIKTHIRRNKKSEKVIEGEGLGIIIARKIYDWMLPSQSFEAWVERVRARKITDAEAERAYAHMTQDRTTKQLQLQLQQQLINSKKQKEIANQLHAHKLKVASDYGVGWDDPEDEELYKQVKENFPTREQAGAMDDPEYEFVPPGGKGLTKAKMVKGSAEMKAHMARLRNMRGKSKGGV